MLFGRGSTLNLGGALTVLLTEAMESDELRKLTRESFLTVGLDGDCKLDRHEFLMRLINMMGLVQEDVMHSGDLQIDIMDLSGR